MSSEKAKERMELVRKLKAAVLSQVAGPIVEALQELESMLEKEAAQTTSETKTKKRPTMGARLLGRYRQSLGGFGLVAPPFSSGRF